MVETNFNICAFLSWTQASRARWLCCVFVSYFYIIFKKIIFIFSGQLLVLLCLSVRLTLYCVTLTFILFTIHFEQ